MAAKTYAQQAKTIMNRYKLRLGDKFDKGDPLAVAAMNAELTELQGKQEETRQTETESTIQLFRDGGKLNKTQHSTLSDLLPTYQGGGELDFIEPDIQVEDWMTKPFETGTSGVDTSTTSGFKSRVPWASIGQGIGDFFANRGDLDLPEYEYEEFTPEKIQARRVDFSREREQIGTERDISNALIRRSAKSTGSQAGLMENILAGQTGTQRVAGEQFGESFQREGNINVQMQTQADLANAQQALQAQRINSRNKLFSTQFGRETSMINEQRRGSRIGALTGGVSQYLKDRQSAGQYDQMVNMEMARNPNYSLKQADPTFWRRLAGITDPITDINFTNTGDTVTNRR